MGRTVYADDNIVTIGWCSTNPLGSFDLMENPNPHSGPCPSGSHSVILPCIVDPSFNFTIGCACTKGMTGRLGSWYEVDEAGRNYTRL